MQLLVKLCISEFILKNDKTHFKSSDFFYAATQ